MRHTLAGPEIDPERWYHVAVTKNPTTVSLFLDGELAAESPSVGPVFYLAIDAVADEYGTAAVSPSGGMRTWVATTSTDGSTRSRSMGEPSGDGTIGSHSAFAAGGVSR